MNKQEAIAEIAAYQEISSTELQKKFAQVSARYKAHNSWSYETEKEFNSLGIDIRNETQLRNFYARTANYIYELMEYHATEPKTRMRQRCVQIMKMHGVRNVLDYGCGIGQDSIDAAQTGLIPAACDIPGATFDFAKWRFRHRNLFLETIDIVSADPLSKIYDAITCFEVVMHTTDPIATVRYLHHHLRSNGLFLFTARFKGYSLALKYNRKYSQNFDRIIQEIGFDRIGREHMWGPLDRRGKFLYIYRKRAGTG